MFKMFRGVKQQSKRSAVITDCAKKLHGQLFAIEGRLDDELASHGMKITRSKVVRREFSYLALVIVGVMFTTLAKGSDKEKESTFDDATREFIQGMSSNIRQGLNDEEIVGEFQSRWKEYSDRLVEFLTDMRDHHHYSMIHIAFSGYAFGNESIIELPYRLTYMIDIFRSYGEFLREA